MDSIPDKLIISPPLDPFASSSLKHQQQSDGTPEKTSLLSRIFDIFKGARPGSDLTRFQVPVQLNMPKSQLQLYGESVYCHSNDLLEECTKGSTPLERFLKVVAWHISTTRRAPFAQAPFNPILGETHHVSCGNLNVLLEQVSHHPPISALYATNEPADLRLQWWHSPSPRFCGNRVEVTIQGKRELWMDAHKEVYEMTSPKLVIRFFPTFGNEWVGKSTIKCNASGFEADLLFHSRPFFGWGSVCKVSGRIIDSSTQTPLFDLSGFYNQKVTIQDLTTGDVSVLFDAEASLTNMKALEVQNRKNVHDKESLVVWREVMKGIVERDWEVARQAKHDIEEKQRSLAKERKRQGVPWIPSSFELIDGKWQWRHTGQPVTQAPLVIPSCPANFF
ncbi:hypothetical protein GOP47_0010216 [Adiantum capillus-veneris]|uniref:Oxysterol-binding protein n=1 Tax=Adiantum capillus-veneris TaxID=13818 RepID=A0A9D4UUW4_ADICA|nr:hypothetical protein GOP47_0010216 [Adiantum capillus-veneris]